MGHVACTDIKMLSKYWPETLTDTYVFGDEICRWMCIQTFGRRRVVNITKWQIIRAYGVNCIHPAQCKGQWWTTVNTVMKVRFHRRREISGPARGWVVGKSL